MKQITVIIPNYNGMHYLKGCLLSLQRQSEPDFEVVLIDNGSDDGSVSYVRKHFPWVKVRAYHRNTGFCRAVNAGIRLAQTPYVVLLNNDTVCDEHMLEELHRAILKPGEGGEGRRFSCAAKMISMKDPSKLDSAGDYLCALGWAFSRGKDRSSAAYSREEECFACCGAAAIYRRDLLLSLGMFDERHFAYLEDVDIGWRARLRGYENWYAPRALVYHAGSATTGSRHNEFKVRLAARNSVYMVWKNMPLWQRAVNGPFLAAGFLIKAGYFTVRGLGGAYMSGFGQGISLCGKARREERAAGRADGGTVGLPGRGRLGNQMKAQMMLYHGMCLLLEDAAALRSFGGKQK